MKLTSALRIFGLFCRASIDITTLSCHNEVVAALDGGSDEREGKEMFLRYMAHHVFSVLLVFFCVTVVSATEYQIVDLGVVGTGFGVSSNGNVTGYWYRSNDYVFLWQNGIASNLGLGMGNGVNDAGQVVGQSIFSSAIRGTLWQNGQSSVLDMPTGCTNSTANSINNGGSIVGASWGATQANEHATLWQNGVAQDLGTLPGGTSSKAVTITDAGQILGSSDDHTVIWQNGVIQDLGVGTANAINDNGVIVGASYTSNGTIASIWQDGAVQLLDAPVGCRLSSAIGIDKSGLVAGFYQDTVTHRMRACFWEDGVLQNLPMIAGCTESDACDMNASGQIVGSCAYASDGRHAVMWTPVPESSSILALLSGLGSVGGMFLRRRR